MAKKRNIVAYVSYKSATERDKQAVLIARYCDEIGKTCEAVTEEVSPSVPWSARKIGEIARDLKAGDVLICDQFSRLGASVVDVVELLSFLAQKSVEVHFARYGVVLDSTLYTRTFLSFLSLFTTIDKEFRGLKIREGKARAKRQPRKSRKGESRLKAKKRQIRRALKRGDSVRAIAKAMEVHYQTMRAFIKANDDLTQIVKTR